MSLQLLIGRADAPRAERAAEWDAERDAEQGKASPLQGTVSGWERVGDAGPGSWWDAGRRGVILPGAAARCRVWSRGGLGRGAAVADWRRVAAYKYLPGSQEGVGGLSSSLNEINGSEA